MKIIVITSPDIQANEPEKIAHLLQCGIDYVHIRKPSWSNEDMKNLIDNIPSELHSRLRLHDHFELFDKYRLGGAHLNNRQPTAPKGVNSISKSCHKLEELLDVSSYEYVTLSPIFDSISKCGYKSSFTEEYLKCGISGKNVIALGGVTPYKFKILKEIGFIGAALLGYVWEVSGDYEFENRINEIIKYR